MAERGLSRFKAARAAAAVDHQAHDPLPAGRRVTVSLDNTHDARNAASGQIIERHVEGPPAPITAPSTSQSVPKPRKIDWRSRPARRAPAHDDKMATAMPWTGSAEPGDEDSLQAEIERENTAQIAGMSIEAVQQEQADLVSKLDPAVVAALRRRAAVKEEARRVQQVKVQTDEEDEVGETYDERFVQRIPAVMSKTAGTTARPERPQPADDLLDEDVAEASTVQSHLSAKTHFPARKLDPDSATFLDDLKYHYFPTLEHDPSKLSWMQPPTDAEDTAQYHPDTSTSLAPGEIRFGFRGELLAPMASRQVAGDTGLHHHADAPRAAGYTLLELALLARSTQPSQASLAMRTLGRVLFRLRQGEFGDAIGKGLQQVVQEARVMETLVARAREPHLTVAAFATEALWQANLDHAAT